MLIFFWRDCGGSGTLFVAAEGIQVQVQVVGFFDIVKYSGFPSSFKGIVKDKGKLKDRQWELGRVGG